MQRVKPRPIAPLYVLGSIALIACGGDDDAHAAGTTSFGKDVTCGVAFELSGALELVATPSRSKPACATQTSFESGIDADFIFIEDELSSVELIVEDVLEGETGAGFPAQLELVHEDGREWRAKSCLAEIIEHEPIGPGELGWERYRVGGTATCDPATSVPSGSGADVIVDTFTFVVTLSWG